MSERIKIDDQAVENVLGGALRWTSDGIVYPKDNPDVQFSYADFDACRAWLVTNWSGIQNEDCLIAMEAAGLVSRI